MANTRGNKFGEKKINKPTREIREFYLNGANDIDGKEYSRESLLDILASVPFGKISIPINLHRGYLVKPVDGGQVKGYMAVGYVIGYDQNEEKFKVVINNKHAAAVDSLGDCIIYVRAAIDKEDNVRTIIGLDIEQIDVEASEQ